MKLPSSSSLLLASLVVLSSSLSALAAPTGDGPESLSSSPAPVLPLPPPAHASIPHGSDDDKIAQPNGAPTSCTHHLSNTTTGYLQVIVGPLIGKDAPKSQEEPLYVVKRLVPAGKTLRAEDASYTSGSSPGEGHY
jgi:hypothetical protein